MAANDVTNSIIKQKIHTIKSQYPFLTNKSDDFAFSAVCIKNSIYKNPSLILTNQFLEDSIIDGTNDGGADFIMLDPNNKDAADLIIGQSKYYSSISFEDAKNAISKMIDFFISMKNCDYGKTRYDVVQRFTSLFAEIGDESKIRFMLFTSAPKNGINESRLKKILENRLGSEDKFELQVFFQNDIEDEIKEAESLRPYVEEGKLDLDATQNVLYFNDEEAAVVNISALSLKKLYARYGTTLLSRNLRYFIKGSSDVNRDVKDTIKNSPETFWYKNNGITIVCENFKVSSKELKLKNFSIVNGGQTTYLIYKSDLNEKCEDFYIVCKVITAQGETEDQRNQFILDVAKATNSQKPIKQSDLKANAPEQIRFIKALNINGIYYQTKRGETIPKEYSEPWKNTEIAEVGKLSLAGIFQQPGTSRNKPSTFYGDKYYNPIFLSSQEKSSRYIRDLLYIDNFFRNSFIKNYNKENEGSQIIPFANNARTICLAYISLCSRIAQGNITDFENIIRRCGNNGFYEDEFYPRLKNFNSLDWIIYPERFKNKDILDEQMGQLFASIILNGFRYYTIIHESVDQSINETNFLKRDSNYYSILKSCPTIVLGDVRLYKELFIKG